MPSSQELLTVATEAARAASDLLRERFGTAAIGVHSKSTPTDPVSEADTAAEEAIRAVLARRRPDDAILGEEQGGRAGASGLRWVIDPLDGTVNFLFGIPHWAVSVACEDAAGALAGVVMDPLRDEVFAATREGAATRQSADTDGPELIAGSERQDLATALVATGFSYQAEVRAEQARVAARVLPRARDLRRLGSAALDLAWTACGRFDAFYERGLHPWDRAAGALICARAGLRLHELAPEDGLPGGLLVAPQPLLTKLREIVDPSR